MNIEEIMLKVQSACKEISDNDPSLWYTTEWNICSHLRERLQKEFSGFNIDVELVKNDGRRPDIVVHKRGENSNNFLIFQVKKNPTVADIESDLNKINETFFSDPYNYQFGIFISIGKLPTPLPEFDLNKIGIMEVYGWRLANEKGELI